MKTQIDELRPGNLVAYYGNGISKSYVEIKEIKDLPNV